MIKLFPILSEIKLIPGNITPKIVIDLYNNNIKDIIYKPGQAEKLINIFSNSGYYDENVTNSISDKPKVYSYINSLDQNKLMILYVELNKLYKNP